MQQEQHPWDFFSFPTIITSGEFGVPLLLLDPDLLDLTREGAPGEGADSWTGVRMDLQSSSACQVSFGRAFVCGEDISFFSPCCVPLFVNFSLNYL